MAYKPAHPDSFDDDEIREIALRAGIFEFEGGSPKPPAPGERAKPAIPWYVRLFLKGT